MVILCLSISVTGLAAKRHHRRRITPQLQPVPPSPQEMPADFPVPTAEMLAKDLKHEAKELPELTEMFVASISEGVRGKSYARLCAKDEDVCRLLADFFSQLDDDRREGRENSRRRVKHFHVTDRSMEQAERVEFSVLVGAVILDDSSSFFRLAEKSLKETACPRNLSAALSIRAEEFYPDEKARALSKQLFEHARQCLSVEDEAYERLYLRRGLYALHEGDHVKATEYLKKASDAKFPKERYRSLYWLGYMENADKTAPDDNKPWQDLLDEYPLSFYSIEAAVVMGKDPMAVILNRKVANIKRVVPGNDQLNAEIRWAEALYLYKKYSTVEKWASWIVRSNEDLDVDTLYYLSVLKIASGLYRSNIAMLFNYFKKNPTMLNEAGLKLLYPRPFFNLIKDATRGKVDSYLVLSLVRQESAFEAHVISHANARGLMQLEPRTARKLARISSARLLNEKDNTRIGVKYLLKLANEFQGSVELVLAAYNAGPLRVSDWMKRNPDREKNFLLWNDLIPFLETRDYVVSILRNNYFYSRLYGGGEPAPTQTVHSEVINRLLAATNPPVTPAK